MAALLSRLRTFRLLAAHFMRTQALQSIYRLLHSFSMFTASVRLSQG